MSVRMNRTVTAPYKTPRCRFNEKGIWKQYSERHPSQPGVLWRVLGRMCGHDRMGGRCRTNGAPGTRVGSAAARQHAGDHSLRRAIASSRANATSIVCRDFRPNHTEQRAIAAPRAFNGLCDDEGVPLICPTCQVLPPKRPCRRPPATLHGVVFDIFVGSHSDAARLRESCLKPHTPARPLL